MAATSQRSRRPTRPTVVTKETRPTTSLSELLVSLSIYDKIEIRYDARAAMSLAYSAPPSLHSGDGKSESAEGSTWRADQLLDAAPASPRSCSCASRTHAGTPTLAEAHSAAVPEV